MYKLKNTLFFLFGTKKSKQVSRKKSERNKKYGKCGMEGSSKVSFNRDEEMQSDSSVCSFSSTDGLNLNMKEAYENILQSHNNKKRNFRKENGKGDTVYKNSNDYKFSSGVNIRWDSVNFGKCANVKNFNRMKLHRLYKSFGKRKIRFEKKANSKKSINEDNRFGTSRKETNVTSEKPHSMKSKYGLHSNYDVGYYNTTIISNNNQIPKQLQQSSVTEYLNRPTIPIKHTVTSKQRAKYGKKEENL